MKHLAFRFIVMACLCFGALGSVAVAQESSVSATGPLSDSAKTVFMGSKEDPPAKKLLGVNESYEGRSYLAGDEWNLHLYYPYIKDSGGGYMGVGSDQGYLIMSWTKPKLGWLIDYDPLVVETHKIYRVFFEKAKTPDEFFALWKKSNRKSSLKLLEEKLGKDKNYKLIRRVFKDWRVKIYRRHSRVRRIMKKEKIPSYLTNQASYDHVRNMVTQGRVRTMVANLLDDEGLVGIGAAAKKLGVPIRTLYLSNAEEYWKYPKQFRKNIAALHFDDKSYTLHTLSTWTTNKDYRYVLQPSLKYVEWLKRDWVKKIYYMVPRRKLKGPEDIDFIVFKKDVEAVEKRRNLRKKKKN